MSEHSSKAAHLTPIIFPINLRADEDMPVLPTKHDSEGFRQRAALESMAFILKATRDSILSRKNHSSRLRAGNCLYADFYDLKVIAEDHLPLALHIPQAERIRLSEKWGASASMAESPELSAVNEALHANSLGRYQLSIYSKGVAVVDLFTCCAFDVAGRTQRVGFIEGAEPGYIRKKGFYIDQLAELAAAGIKGVSLLGLDFTPDEFESRVKSACAASNSIFQLIGSTNLKACVSNQRVYLLDSDDPAHREFEGAYQTERKKRHKSEKTARAARRYVGPVTGKPPQPL